VGLRIGLSTTDTFKILEFSIDLINGNVVSKLLFNDSLSEQEELINVIKWVNDETCAIAIQSSTQHKIVLYQNSMVNFYLI
jgi:hypothetical protein